MSSFHGEPYVSRLVGLAQSEKEIAIENVIRARVNSLSPEVIGQVSRRVVLHKTACEADITEEDNEPTQYSNACFGKTGRVDNTNDFVALQTPEFQTSAYELVKKFNKTSRKEDMKEPFQNRIRHTFSDVFKALAQMNVNQRQIVIHSDLHTGNVGIFSDETAAIADWGESFTLNLQKSIRDNELKNYKFFRVRNGDPGNPLIEGDDDYSSAEAFNKAFPQHSLARCVWFQIRFLLIDGQKKDLVLSSNTHIHPLCKILIDQWNNYKNNTITHDQFLDIVTPTVHYIEQFNDFIGFQYSVMDRISKKYYDWKSEIEKQFQPLLDAYVNQTLTQDRLLDFAYFYGDMSLIRTKSTRKSREKAPTTVAVAPSMNVAKPPLFPKRPVAMAVNQATVVPNAPLNSLSQNRSQPGIQGTRQTESDKVIKSNPVAIMESLKNIK